MKTMLAMALAFGFSALGCGMPVDENAPVLEEEAQALTTYTGHCEVSGTLTNGMCSVDTPVGTCPTRGKSTDCVIGQSIPITQTTPIGCARTSLTLRRTTISCAFNQ